MYRITVFLALLMFCAFLTSGCLPGVGAPTTAVPPQRILFIGDSLTCWHTGLDAHVKGMAESADPSTTVETASVCIGAAPLAEHWRKGAALEQIRDGDWDVVVLQEDLAMYGGRIDVYEQAEAAFHASVKLFDEEIRQQGARTVLYLPQTYDYELSERPKISS